MLEKLQRLYGTLETIETKGKSTRIMATCLSYLENIIDESRTTEITVPSDSEPKEEENQNGDL